MPTTLTATRDSLHGDTHWIAAAFAGIVAGIVFIMLEMIMVALVMGESPWGPPRMMAAMVMGKSVLPPPASFDFTIMMVAMMVHLALAIAYGFIGGWLVHRHDMGLAIAIGAAFGIAIYIVNFYFVAPAAFPWFVDARNWISAFTHIVFGAVLGAAYVLLRRPRREPA